MSTPSLYSFVSSHLVLDNAARRYIFKIRDLPTEQKPRERLKQYGPKNLSSAELLAIVLNTGTPKEDVLALAHRLLREYGGRGLMAQLDVNTLMDELQLPEGKAAKIIACAELGRRFFARNAATSPVLRTAEDVFAHSQEMTRFSKEHLRGIYLNSHYKVIHEETLSIGTIDASLIHPREVFKPAVEYAAAGVILVHNHPSGEIAPSEMDIEITEQLIKAGAMLGVSLIDHVVVTADGFQSIPANYQG